jgi:hypothetical protein
MANTITKAKVMAAAAKKGMVVEDDGTCLSVYFESGKHDGSGCHELVTEIDRYESKSGAWADVLEDINIDWQDCKIENCDWCG